MICYRCGTLLGSGKHCLHCGVDVTTYKKIVRISNGYYNAGLEKARLRDLSGAREELLRALKFDRKNIQARNLLGLVYYETGEVVEALCQWVISKNFQPLENPAEGYINAIQDSRTGLETMNQGIKGYNTALQAARTGGSDLAIIKLQRVLGTCPHMMKAYQLLTLLYIKTGEYSKANRTIKKGLQIDKGNVTLQRYGREIRGKLGKPKSEQKQSMYIEQAAAAAEEEVIVPKYRETPRVLQLLTGVFIGIAVCVAGYYYLIRPSVSREIQNNQNQLEISYNEKMEDKEATVLKLESDLDEITGQLTANKKLMEQYDGEDGTITNYNRLFEALQEYKNENWTKLMTLYEAINADPITDPNFRQTYDELGDFIYGDGMIEKIFAEAIELFTKGRYVSCREVCSACLSINPDHPGAMYYMALSWEAQGNDAKAAPYFQEIVERFPECEWFEQAKRRVV